MVRFSFPMLVWLETSNTAAENLPHPEHDVRRKMATEWIQPVWSGLCYGGEALTGGLKRGGGFFFFFFGWMLSKCSLLLLANPSFCGVPFVKRNLSGIISKWYYSSEGRMTRKWHTTQNAPALCKRWINRRTTWCACFSSPGSGCSV